MNELIFISYHIINIFVKRLRQSYRGADHANWHNGTLLLCTLFLSRVYVVDRNWSARKQRLPLQHRVDGISHHSALSEDRIQQCGSKNARTDI